MNREDIIRMAREAECADNKYPFSEIFIVFAERFAALVAEHEREACAKLCEEMASKDGMYRYAAAIRERSKV